MRIVFLRKFYQRFIFFNMEGYAAEKIQKLHDLIKSGRGGAFRKRQYRKLLLKYCCSVPYSCKIGSNLSLPHGLFGIFISQDAVIGDNCVIFQQVTIGSNNLNGSENTGAPVIGDNVYIGAGAKIIGKCKVGNNVRIGANTVVTTDVPDNATVVGVHSRIILHEGILDNKFIPK